ncbi:MAG: tape measure protein [Acidobacteria bacterium]|nr:tape measure protein [Acidobacteriota bacterium]
MIQFAQGLASGRLAGEELRAVLEQMPRLARAIADGLGVPFGQLRDLAAKGRLDAQSVIDAVLSQADVLEREYGSVERTVGQAAIQLRNEFQQLAGRVDEAFSVREGFIRFLDRVRAKVRDLFTGEETPEREAGSLDDRIAAARARLEEAQAALEAAPSTTTRRQRRLGISSRDTLQREVDEAAAELAAAEALLPENIRRTIAGLKAELDEANGRLADARGPERRNVAREIQGIRAEIGRAERIAAEQVRAAAAAAADAAGGERPAPAVDPKAVEAREAAERELLGTFERQRAEARITRDELLARFDEQAEGYADYAARIEAQYQGTLKQIADDEAADAETRADRIEAAREREARAAERAQRAAQRAQEAAERELERLYRTARDARTGAHRALGDIAFEATDAGAQVESAVVNAFGNMEAAIERLRRTGKANFGDLVDSIIADVTRLFLRLQVTGPLALLLQSLLGGAVGGRVGLPLGDGSQFANFAHGGGIAGALRTGRRVPAGIFAFAPRLHRGGIPGLRDNEVPAILEEGEGVFTREQMAALGGLGGPREVVVQIRNESGTEIEARDSVAEFDGIRRLVVGVVVDQVANGGEIDGALRGAYGVRRQAL